VTGGGLALAHGVAAILYAAGALGRARRAGLALAGIGAALQAAALAGGWAAAGHGPYLSPSETLAADAWLLAVATLALSLRGRVLVRVGCATLPGCAAMSAAAAALGFPAIPLPVVMRNAWLDLHALAYALAFVALALATAAAVLGARTGAAPPGADARRCAGLGLAFTTLGMLLGSIWGYDTSGVFWRWDPVEIWALVAWLGLGMHLHVLRFYAPGPRARAFLQAGAFSLAVFAQLVVPRIGALTHAAFMAP
jgi:cytochrome c biogenesis factor